MKENLLKRLIDLLQIQGVCAAWLIGSRAIDLHDAFSDIDIALYEDDNQKALALFQKLRTAIKDWDDIVYTKTLPHSLTLNAVTQEWDRFDISIVSNQELIHYPQDSVRILFDTIGMDAILPKNSAAAPIDIRPLLIDTVSEFIRLLGLLPIVLGRKNYITATSGVHMMKDLFITLTTIEISPYRFHGKLSVEKYLLPDDKAILSPIAAVQPNEASLVAANRALVAVFLPRAKLLYTRYGLQWPTEFEKAALHTITEKLGITF